MAQETLTFHAAAGATLKPFAQEEVIRPSYGHWIGNEWVEGESGKTIDVINPATGAVISHIQAGEAADVDRAVRSAHEAFKSWSRTHPIARQKALQEMARRLREQNLRFATIESIDNGKPITEALNHDLGATIGAYEYFGSLPLHVQGTTSDFPNAVSLVHREPLGVCAAIVPWNIPLFCTALKVAAALATGNTVVVKPAESTCLSILEFFHECADILPPGVVNVVTGYGQDAGDALVRHPLVRKVSFTGSKPTARKIMQAASQNIIPQTMELGGKSANIICADANIDAAAEGVVMSTIFNKGEVCIAGSRVFVHESVKDELLEKVSRLLSGIRQGDPLDSRTQLGAQASQVQFDKVMSYLQLGPSEGASLVAGGERATIPGFEKGLFVKPTIFDNVRNDMRIAQEEIFGPVTCVLGWRDEEEVLRLANETDYGLGGGIWTRDISRAHRFAREMQTGMVWINRYYNITPGQPLGGVKHSGFGRENTFETLYHYTQTKAVVINLDDAPLGIYNA